MGSVLLAAVETLQHEGDQLLVRHHALMTINTNRSLFGVMTGHLGRPDLEIPPVQGYSRGLPINASPATRAHLMRYEKAHSETWWTISELYRVHERHIDSKGQDARHGWQFFLPLIEYCRLISEYTKLEVRIITWYDE